MKKHSLAEHLDNVYEWMNKQQGGTWLYGDWKMIEQRLWFTAYERWLNNRSLLTDEDAIADRAEG